MGDPPVISTWQTTSTSALAGSTEPTIASTDSPATTAQFHAPGTYTETLGAVDSDGDSAKSSMTVTVCPDVELITAQGVNLNGKGRAGQDIFDSFIQSFQKAYSKKYGLPNGTIAAAQESITGRKSLCSQGLASDIVNAYYEGHLTDIDGRQHTEERFTPNYYNTVQAGITDLGKTVSHEQAICPKTKIVLVGYSEGSDVVQQYLQPNPANIVAAYIYGSPRFTDNDARDSTGSARTGGSFAVVNRQPGLMGAFPGGYTSAVKLSTCDINDLVCQGIAVPQFCVELTPELLTGALPTGVEAFCGFAIAQSLLGILPHGAVPGFGFLGYAPDAAIDGGQAAQNISLLS